MQSQFLHWLKWNFDALLTRYLPLSLSLSVSKSQSIYQYFAISPFLYTMFISCLFWQFIIHHSFRITLCDYRHRAYFRFHCHFRFRFLLLLRRLLLSLPLPFAFAFACFCCWLCFCLPALSVKFFYVLLLLSLSAALSAALLAALPLLPKHIKLSHRRVRRCRFAYGGNAPKSKFGAFVRPLPLSLPLSLLSHSLLPSFVRLSACRFCQFHVKFLTFIKCDIVAFALFLFILCPVIVVVVAVYVTDSWHICYWLRHEYPVSISGLRACCLQSILFATLFSLCHAQRATGQTKNALPTFVRSLKWKGNQFGAANYATVFFLFCHLRQTASWWEMCCLLSSWVRNVNGQPFCLLWSAAWNDICLNSLLVR